MPRFPDAPFPIPPPSPREDDPIRETLETLSEEGGGGVKHKMTGGGGAVLVGEKTVDISFQRMRIRSREDVVMNKE